MSRPMVITVCMFGSSESWALGAPTSMALACRVESRLQHRHGHQQLLCDCGAMQKYGCVTDAMGTGSLSISLGAAIASSPRSSCERRELSAEQPALQRPLCPRLAEI